MGLLWSPDTTSPSDEIRSEKENKGKLKRETGLVGFARKQGGSGDSGVRPRVPLSHLFMTFLGRKSPTCVKTFINNQLLCFLWLLQKAGQAASSLRNSVPGISRSGFEPQLTIFNV